MPSSIIMRWPGGKEKAVTLSYDDNVRFDKRLIEIMSKHGLKGTFNVNSTRFYDDNDWFLSKKEALELYNGSGNEVAVHSLTHAHFIGTSPAEITYEIIQDRLNLEEMFGHTIRGMAYPYGDCNDEIKTIAKNCGIVYSRGTQTTHAFNVPTDWLNYPCTAHHADPELDSLVENFVNFKFRQWDRPWLFALWGHSYEFHQENNWDVIERFAEKIGNREDYYYATNIEIYDYVHAYESLIKSANGKVIYNPTQTEVWAKNGEETISIAPGATITLD